MGSRFSQCRKNLPGALELILKLAKLSVKGLKFGCPLGVFHPIQIRKLRLDSRPLGPASTLADAAVQLRRLAAWIDSENEVPARLLDGALEAVGRAAEGA